MVDFQYKGAYDFEDFREVIRILREPGGCPWDREQNHESIRRNLLEEAYEAAEAIDDKDTEHLKEELGDLLMQVLLHSRMEEEQGSFSLDDVADTAVKKLILRHPHVFGDTEVGNSAEVLRNWDEIKRREREQSTVSSAMDGVSRALPSLWRADKIQSKARSAGFDWLDYRGALDKLHEELGELIKAADGSGDVFEEIGDVLFAAVNTARLLKVDPEKALNASCDKFISRFRFIEKRADENGRKLSEMTLSEMEELYQERKALEQLARNR